MGRLKWEGAIGFGWLVGLELEVNDVWTLCFL
jgi:hypothetical protein